MAEDTDIVYPTQADRRELIAMRQTLRSIFGPGGLNQRGRGAAGENKPHPVILYVKLTAGDNASGFDWVEAIPPQGTDPSNVMPGGRTSTQSGVLAYEANLRGGTVGDFTFLTYMPTYLGAKLRGIFVSLASRGQYQYMLFQMVSQNATGWDFGLAHPPVI